MDKYHGKSLAVFCEQEGITLFQRSKVKEDKTFFKKAFSEEKEEFVMKQMLYSQPLSDQAIFFKNAPNRNLFCARKEGMEILFYKTEKNRERTLSYTGSMKIGDEMAGAKSISERLHQLVGSGQRHLPILFGEGTFAEYPFPYKESMFGERLISYGTVEGLFSILKKASQKKISKMSKEEEELLFSFPELKAGALPELPFGKSFPVYPEPGYKSYEEYVYLRNEEKEEEISCVLEMLSEEVCRITAVQISDKKSLFEGEKEILPDLGKEELLIPYQLFLYKSKKGKIKQLLLTRGLYGKWEKESSSLLRKMRKQDTFFFVKGEEEGFLKYPIRHAKGSMYFLLSSIEMPFFEKLHAFPGVLEKISAHRSSEPLSRILNPKGKTLEEAFGISMKNLHLLEKAAFSEKADFLKMQRKICLHFPEKMRSLNEEDYKKLLFFFMQRRPYRYALFVRYEEKEACKEILRLSKQSFSHLMEGFSRFLSVYEKRNPFQFSEKPKSWKISRWGDAFHLLSPLMDAQIALLKKESFLTDFISGKLKTIDFDFNPHLSEKEAPEKASKEKIFNEMLFLMNSFSPKRKKSLEKIVDLLEKGEEEEAQKFFFEIEEGEAFSLSELQEEQVIINQNIYDMVRMMVPLSKEELSAMGTTFPFSCKEVKRQHDRVMNAFNIKIHQVDDAKIQKIREKNLNLEYASEEFVMLLPKRTLDLIEEGAELGHCVASYAGNVAKDRTKILFVRKKESPEKPLCTVELQKGEVIQIQGKFHNYPRRTSLGEDKKIYEFIRSWAEKHDFVMAV